MQFSNDQQKAYDQVMQWFKTKEKFFVLSGYAGTGKTTLAKYIARDIGEGQVLFCAYTGKAANVLREKGCPNAGTIHSYLYKLSHQENGQPVFGLDPDTPFMSARLVIVDEFSMLSDDLIRDINNHSKKVLYLGDPFQLPPVNDEQTLLTPHCFLEEVHRQALDSPILRAATMVRQGQNLPLGDYGDFQHVRHASLSNEDYMSHDQIIVGFNDKRKQINATYRRLKGFDQINVFMPGEKIICLRNCRETGLFNGMIGNCKSSDAETRNSFRLSFECDGRTYNNLLAWSGDIVDGLGKYDYKSKLQRFDYAYAITCHKSQGSEFDSVIIQHQPVGDNPTDRRRWAYTALTRAKKRATLVQM